MSSQSYGFYVSQWQTNSSKILQLRQDVLVEEYGGKIESIQELNDPESFHIIAYDGDSNAIGTGSMSIEGIIKHVVVLNKWRRRTIGKAIVLYLLNIAKIKNLPCTVVTAPESLLGFYQSLKFEKTDVTVMLQGVRHLKLVRPVRKSKAIVH